MKNKKIILITILITILILLFFVKGKHYDINNPPKKYFLRTDEEQSNYIEFIKGYIYPEKLRNFLNNKYIDFLAVRTYNSGIESVAWFKYEAYTELFNKMFDKDRSGFDDCPVTNNFKIKFGNNLFNYFNFNDVNDCVINCGILDKEKKLNVVEAGDFNVGEPGYIYYHHFHYVLDEEGNVDDVVFDYTEE